LQFWLVVVAAFVGLVGVGAVIPTLPPHVRADLGHGDLAVGVLVGLFSLAGLLARLVAGRYTDRRGRRAALALGLGGTALGGGLYLLPFGVPSLAAGRVVHGFFEAFVYTGAAVWAIDRSPADRRGRVLALIGSAVWGGFTIGPLIGEALGSFRAVALFVAGAPILGLLLLTGVPESWSRVRATGRTPLVPRPALGPGLALGLTNVAYAALAGFLVLRLSGHGGGGYAFAAYAGAVLAGRLVLGHLPDRIGPATSLLVSHGVMLAGLVAIALEADRGVATVAAALVGLGYSLQWPALAAFTVDRVDPGVRGAAIGTLTAFFDLFVGAGSLVAGAIASKFGYAAVFWLAAGCVALGGSVATFVTRPRLAPTGNA
jgi:MFS family permease